MNAPEKQSVEEEPNDDRNPLWVVVMGMAWLFGIMVAVVAFTSSN